MTSEYSSDTGEKLDMHGKYLRMCLASWAMVRVCKVQPKPMGRQREK